MSRWGEGGIVLAGALFDNLKAFRLPKARLNFLQTMPRLCERKGEGVREGEEGGGGEQGPAAGVDGQKSL